MANAPVTDNAPVNAEEAALSKERYWWVFESFARGPDTIFYGSVYFPMLLYLAASDAICQVSSDGISSGADGEKCTVDDTWNRTLWRSVNGAACGVENDMYGMKTITYSQDATLSEGACGTALKAYANITSFTCNCTGDHAFLSSGLRPGNVVLTSIITHSIVVALISPVLGSIIDHTDKRRYVWLYLGIAAGVCNMLASIIGPGGVWIIGLAFATAVAVSTEILWTAKAAFLEDIATTDALRGQLGGMAQVWSFGSQLIFIVVVAALQFTVSPTMAGSIGAIICGLWLGGFEALSVRGMRDRPAKRTRPANRSLVSVGFSELKVTVCELFVKYPECGKYLLFTTVVKQGAGAFLSIYSTYFTLQMKLTGMQVLIISGIVLVVGMPAGYAFAWLANRWTLRKLWFIVLGLWIFLGIVTPAFVYKEQDIVPAIIVGVFYSVGLSWYYSVGYQAFVALVPAGHSMEYAGLYTLWNFATSWISPTIYLAVFQSSNNQRLAISTLIGWNIVAAAFLYNVDFEKGKIDAGAPDAIVPGQQQIELTATAVKTMKDEGEPPL
jgi:MFS-type transporter involved in bile tolerance (Atg22 family)